METAAWPDIVCPVSEFISDYRGGDGSTGKIISVLKTVSIFHSAD